MSVHFKHRQTCISVVIDGLVCCGIFHFRATWAPIYAQSNQAVMHTAKSLQNTCNTSSSVSDLSFVMPVVFCLKLMWLISAAKAAPGSCFLGSTTLLNIAFGFGFSIFICVYVAASFSGGYLLLVASASLVLGSTIRVLSSAIAFYGATHQDGTPNFTVSPLETSNLDWAE